MQIITGHGGDFHNQYDFNCGEGNLFCIHGDFTNGGRVDELEKFAKFLDRLKNNWDFVVVGLGNHEIGLDDPIQLQNFKAMIEGQKVKVLVHEPFKIFGLNLFVTPYVHHCGPYPFTMDHEQLRQLWKTLPQMIDLMICHGPPKGILDRGTGDYHLLERLLQIPTLKLVQFGHIHEGYGVQEFKNITWMNCALGLKNFEPVFVKKGVWEVEDNQNTLLYVEDF